MAYRIDAGLDVIAQIKPFNLEDEKHLSWIDWRLNLNELVGASVKHTPERAPFLNGQTILDAMIAIVPRAIWPSKPVTAGSGDHVSRQTGILFAEGTSVGMGQVLEFYINFGTNGVVIGFFVLGIVLCFMDARLASAIERSDWNAFALWFVVGTSALQVGGALSEMTGSMAAGAVITLIARRFVGRRGTTGQEAVTRSG